MEQIITRHRHETRRRSLTITEIFRLTPNMIRVELAGEDLADFISLGADDHIKIFPEGAGDGAEMRDYTPRRYDNAAQSLTVDFAVHGEGSPDQGPATRWVMTAAPGDRLEIGGPRGSAVVAPVFDWYLLIGDETALPAIGRRAEELEAGVRVLTLAAVDSAADEQVFETRASHEPHWVHRPLDQAHEPGPLLDALAGLALPEGRGFVWIAAEASVTRALRAQIFERGHPKEWVKAAGYWVRGAADTTEKFD
ncbi:siderophore-interacting protein [Paracoccus aminophilus]|uniref:Siderophore-interacting protein n=1 Tax=Paracoccus aminophilus JCM 7686 TaxID=1367847 RepID=S5YGW2_PARAH|nr:siderophore-interacting protein [Paracoccus aminophilus]AGT10708.1 siderophore-interacting protein [Paracoccus aminophilus JCM 7686]